MALHLLVQFQRLPIVSGQTLVGWGGHKEGWEGYPQPQHQHRQNQDPHGINIAGGSRGSKLLELRPLVPGIMPSTDHISTENVLRRLT